MLGSLGKRRPMTARHRADGAGPDPENSSSIGLWFAATPVACTESAEIRIGATNLLHRSPRWWSLSLVAPFRALKRENSCSAAEGFPRRIAAIIAILNSWRREPMATRPDSGHDPEGGRSSDWSRAQSPSKAGLCLAANPAKARPKSFVIIQSACACASDSIISSIPIAHS